MIFYLVTCTTHPVAPLLASSIPGHIIPTYSIPSITLLPSAVLIYTSTRTLLWREMTRTTISADAGHRSSFPPSWHTSTLPLTSLSHSSISSLNSSPSYARSLVGLSIVSLVAQTSILFLLALAVGRRVRTRPEGDAARE